MEIPSSKTILDLVKKGLTIEAQEEIIKLRQAALDCQDENLRLRKEVAELKARIEDLENDAGEPCPKCHRKTWLLESSRKHEQLGIAGVLVRVYKCSACGFTEEEMITP